MAAPRHRQDERICKLYKRNVHANLCALKTEFSTRKTLSADNNPESTRGFPATVYDARNTMSNVRKPAA